MNQQNNNNEDWDWGKGLMCLSGVVMFFGSLLDSSLGMIAAIVFAIGFLRWLWFET